MKHLLTTSTVLLGLFLLSLTNIQNASRKNPPGTIYVKSLGYYVDDEAMSVAGWQEFIWHSKNAMGHSDSFTNLLLPDTVLIKLHYGKNVFNSRDKEDVSVPIVGVSLFQIQEYCKFRTWAVRQVKKYQNTDVTYALLDYKTYANLSRSDSRQKNKRISIVSSKVTEVIDYEGAHKFVVSNDSLVNQEDFNDVFGFRCIAKYK